MNSMKTGKKILVAVLIGLLLFICFLFYNLFSYKSRQIKVATVKEMPVSESAFYRLASSLKIKTVSTESGLTMDSLEFNKFSDFLSTNYPLIDSMLERVVVNKYSSLYIWKGSNPALKPVILMAHLDVVPVLETELKDWTHPPFDGKIVDDTLWGRGAIDDKIGLIGIMEAVEGLLERGFIPGRTMYIAFGHDEEIGGQNGAAAIASYLKEKGVNAEFVLDEGGSIVQRMVPGIEKDVALIGVSEKGFVSLELMVDMEGGHSSMPNSETSIDIIAKAINKLRSNQFPAKLCPALEGFIDELGPEMPALNKFVFANRFIFEPLILDIYEGSAAGNALVRTTLVPTIFNSGVKDNVIPRLAKATINIRILPGSSIDEVINEVKGIIDDERIRINKNDFYSEPSKTSTIISAGYRILNTSILEVFTEVLTAPNLVIGATDSRHFESISSDIYRFLPIYINPENIKTFHGINERIAKRDFNSAVRFYSRLIQNCN